MKTVSAVDVEPAVAACVAERKGVYCDADAWAEKTVCGTVIGHIDRFAASERSISARAGLAEVQASLGALYTAVVPVGSRKSLVYPTTFLKDGDVSRSRVLVVVAVPTQEEARRGAFDPNGAAMNFGAYLVGRGVPEADLALAAFVPYYPGSAWGANRFNSDKWSTTPPKSVERVFGVYMYRVMQCMKRLKWVISTSAEANALLLNLTELDTGTRAQLVGHVNANLDPKRRAFRPTKLRLEVNDKLVNVAMGGQTVTLLRLLSPFAFKHDEDGKREREAAAAVAGMVGALKEADLAPSAVAQFFGASSGEGGRKRMLERPDCVQLSDFAGLVVLCATPTVEDADELAQSRFTTLVDMSVGECKALARGRERLYTKPPMYWKEGEFSKRYPAAVLLDYCETIAAGWDRGDGAVIFSERDTMAAPALVAGALYLFANPDMGLDDAVAWLSALLGEGVVTAPLRESLYSLLVALATGSRRVFYGQQEGSRYRVVLFSVLTGTFHVVGEFVYMKVAYWFCNRVNKLLVQAGARPAGPVISIDAQHAFVIPTGDEEVGVIRADDAAISGYGAPAAVRTSAERYQGTHPDRRVVAATQPLVLGARWGEAELKEFKQSAAA